MKSLFLKDYIDILSAQRKDPIKDDLFIAKKHFSLNNQHKDLPNFEINGFIFYISRYKHIFESTYYLYRVKYTDQLDQQRITYLLAKNINDIKTDLEMITK